MDELEKDQQEPQGSAADFSGKESERRALGSGKERHSPTTESETGNHCDRVQIECRFGQLAYSARDWRAESADSDIRAASNRGACQGVLFACGGRVSF